MVSVISLTGHTKAQSVLWEPSEVQTVPWDDMRPAEGIVGADRGMIMRVLATPSTPDNSSGQSIEICLAWEYVSHGL